MCQLRAKDVPPAGGAPADVAAGTGAFTGLGALFREHGEDYIDKYRPDLRTIRLIRSIRLCRTPALGGRRFECPDCGDRWYRYFSCGHSHCPLCQGNKRQTWYERVEANLLKVPYCHVTFTLPHEFNGLCRLAPVAMYNLLFGSAWRTLREMCGDTTRLGGLPGMTAVLHTWGSDLKHHVHVHCLVTFGGLDERSGRWCWPRKKHQLLPCRPLCDVFRDNFLRGLQRWMTRMGRSVYHQSYGVLTAGLSRKRWVVNQQPPTMEAEVINAYLSRYICRIGISDSRLNYDPKTQRVEVEFKNYRKQQKGEAAPVGVMSLPALLAMSKILQHVLPAGFHRTRHYGLHAPNTRKRLAGKLDRYVKGAPDTVVMLLRIVKALLRAQLQLCCKVCGSVRLPEATLVEPDRHFIRPYLKGANRAPPMASEHPSPKPVAV